LGASSVTLFPAAPGGRCVIALQDVRHRSAERGTSAVRVRSNAVARLGQFDPQIADDAAVAGASLPAMRVDK